MRLLGPPPGRGSIRHELDARRAEFCRSIAGVQECSTGERDPFFCDLGTLGCTEAHGDSWEHPWYLVNIRGITRFVPDA